MTPVPIRDSDNDGVAALLDTINFRTRPLAERNIMFPRSEIMLDGGAFISWWRPSLWERLRLLCGSSVRVMINYSDGPLRVDTEPTADDPSPADW
jgi:hypothetical protein